MNKAQGVCLAHGKRITTSPKSCRGCTETRRRDGSVGTDERGFYFREIISGGRGDMHMALEIKSEIKNFAPARMVIIWKSCDA